MSARVNPQDPRVKRTKRLLQQAFIELLKKKDFDAITIQDITESAEVNRATFYSHYQDKYELLELTLATMFNDTLSRWIPNETNMDGQTIIRNLMLAICQWQLETQQHINKRLTLSSAIEENTKKQLYNIILSCLKQTQSKESLEHRKSEVMATMISWSIYGIVMQWSSNRWPETAEDLANHALPIILSSLKDIDIQ